MEFLKKVKETIDRYKMLNVGDKVLVGVSGGPDSMALLLVLSQLKKHYQLSLLVAHYNHKLRGIESEQEAEFIKIQSERMDIPCIIENDDGDLLNIKNNREEIARKKRYDFFARKARELKAEKVALGHTATDQAETFFLWLFRGAGTKGLRGIPPVRDGWIIRPLIEIERKEILEFLQRNHIPWKEDSSNRNTCYFRNKIREFLFPLLLQKFAPQLVKGITKVTEILHQEDIFLEKLAEEKFKKIKTLNENYEVLLKINELLALPLALRRRVIRMAIKTARGSLRRINFEHGEKIINALANPNPYLKFSLPEGLEVIKESEFLKFAFRPKKIANPLSFYYEFNSLPEVIDIPEIGKKIKIEVLPWSPGQSPIGDKNIALFDYEKIRYPLIVRNRRPGDRFQPLGTFGIKKLKNFFIDLKIPREERGFIPLIIFGEVIAWVVGERIDHRMRVTRETEKVVRMMVE